VSRLEKFDRLAHGYSAHDYADPARYGRRRVEIALELAAPLDAGATVLDLACGDGNLAEPLLDLGYRYRGVDGSAAMVEEARARLGDSVPFEVGLIDAYEPPEPVDLTLCMRAFYYAADRRAFFAHVAGYTRNHFVFDFDPRVYERKDIDADLRAAGFAHIVYRPFFLPQRAACAGSCRFDRARAHRSGRTRRAARARHRLLRR
jgi:SAM-dependent methyltransferase